MCCASPKAEGKRTANVSNICVREQQHFNLQLPNLAAPPMLIVLPYLNKTGMSTHVD